MVSSAEHFPRNRSFKIRHPPPAQSGSESDSTPPHGPQVPKCSIAQIRRHMTGKDSESRIAPNHPARHPGEPRIGVQGRPRGPERFERDWIPASAGMTDRGGGAVLGAGPLRQQHWVEYATAFAPRSTKKEPHSPRSSTPRPQTRHISLKFGCLKGQMWTKRVDTMGL